MKQLIATSIFGLLLSLLCAASASAQRTDFQAWSQLTTQFTLDKEKKWLFYFEAQPRVGDDISRLERLLIRPAIGYNYDKNITFYLGYGWTPTSTDSEYEGDFRNENRIWQQMSIKQSALGLDWVHRLREEQRMIDDASSVSNRFRYLLRGSYQFCDCQDFGLTGYNELFVTLNSVERGPRAGFDRNRFFFGPFWGDSKARFEVGYLGEYGKRFGNDDRMINAVAVAAFLNF